MDVATLQATSSRIDMSATISVPTVKLSGASHKDRELR